MITISKLLDSLSRFVVSTAEAQARSRLVAPEFFSRFE
jgi:hypothetical protein